jgi:hypothetical protein
VVEGILDLMIANIQRQIVVTLRVPAFHNWPGAPDPDIEFLRARHRHEFHIKCWKTVSHSDRDIEIIRFKTQVIDYLNYSFPKQPVGLLGHLELGSTSCEMLAEKLCDYFGLDSCEVLEDFENGAKVTVTRGFI